MTILYTIICAILVVATVLTLWARAVQGQIDDKARDAGEE